MKKKTLHPLIYEGIWIDFYIKKENRMEVHCKNKGKRNER
jgi:hypothetical protein